MALKTIWKIKTLKAVWSSTSLLIYSWAKSALLKMKDSGQVRKEILQSPFIGKNRIDSTVL